MDGDMGMYEDKKMARSESEDMDLGDYENKDGEAADSDASASGSGSMEESNIPAPPTKAVARPVARPAPASAPVRPGEPPKSAQELADLKATEDGSGDNAEAEVEEEEEVYLSLLVHWGLVGYRK